MVFLWFPMVFHQENPDTLAHHSKISTKNRAVSDTVRQHGKGHLQLCGKVGGFNLKIPSGYLT